MHSVYVLYSKNFDKIYVGFTSHLKGRLSAHNHESNSGWTSKYKPWDIIYTEEFSEKRMAMKREQELKSSRGRSFIRTLIK